MIIELIHTIDIIWGKIWVLIGQYFILEHIILIDRDWAFLICFATISSIQIYTATLLLPILHLKRIIWFNAIISIIILIMCILWSISIELDFALRELLWQAHLRSVVCGRWLNVTLRRAQIQRDLSQLCKASSIELSRALRSLLNHGRVKFCLPLYMLIEVLDIVSIEVILKISFIVRTVTL